MRAMVYHNYGPPENLELVEVEKPPVRDEDVLVKVHAASVNWVDWHFLTGSPFMARLMVGGLLKPKHTILGVDLAGRVETVGSAVTKFRVGDDVFGGCGKGGAFAEYVCVAETDVQRKPTSITFEEGAAVGAAASVALQGLRDAGRLRAGYDVLINGASGGVGTFAVQIAKALGATVTGVCSTRNLEMVQSMDADKVIDYTQEDFTRSQRRFDLIFDVAAKLSFSDCKRVLGPAGVFVTTKFLPAFVLGRFWTRLAGGKELVPFLAKPLCQNDLAYMCELLEARRVRPTIDRRYPLGEVPAALRYLAQGHARGKVVISV